MTDIADVRPGDKVRAEFKDERGRTFLVEGEATAYGSGLYLFGTCLHYSDGMRGQDLISFDVLEPALPPEPDADTIVRDDSGLTWRKFEKGWQTGADAFLSWPLDWPGLFKKRPLDLYRHVGRIEP